VGRGKAYIVSDGVCYRLHNFISRTDGVDIMSPTGEYPKCEHVWRELSQEERDRYGFAASQALSNWRECTHCKQVKYVGKKAAKKTIRGTMPAFTVSLDSETALEVD